MKLSVIIPSYNACDWLSRTIPKIFHSISEAQIQTYEIIVVDDGSTDDTRRVVTELPKKYKTKVLSQKNKGRYLARKSGIDAAKYDNILLVDSRVYIDKTSLKYIVSQQKKDPTKKIWNAHVNIDKKGNIFARFWDALVQIAWRKYFSNPREVSYSIDDFDYYPKGTTCFFAPKKVLVEAMDRYEASVDKVTKTSNDDTLVIREIAKKNQINISPKFSCLYHSRSNLKQFIKHVFHRGQVFSDGFLSPGNRFFLPLLCFFVFTSIFPLVLLFNPAIIIQTLALAAVLLLSVLLIALFLLSDKRDALSLWLLTPVFLLFYGAGIWIKAISKFKEYFIAAAIYLTYTLYYLRDVVGKCSTTLIGVPSDSAGLTWLNAAYPNSPWWGFTSWSNFPIGENLWQPTYIVSQVLYIPYWVLSKLSGSICGYNLLIAAGFMFSSIVAFSFFRWLLRYKSFWPALFGGFALCFMPYLLVKVPAHPSYVFNGAFVLLLWAMLVFITKPSKPLAISIGVILGSICYLDPYFVLLAGIMLFGFAIGVVANYLIKRERQHTGQIIKNLTYTLLTAVIIVLPLLTIRYINKDKINSFVVSSRGDIRNDAQVFGARPWEFILPEVHNPYTPFSLKTLQFNRLHGSNYTENGLYLGWTVIGLALVYLISILRRRARSINFDNQKLATILLSIFVIAGIFSLPPEIRFLGLKIPSPSFVIVEFTSIWRVFARLVIIMQIALATMAALGLYQLLLVKNKKFRAIIIGTIFFLLFIEFSVQLPAWNTEKAHTVYSDIKNDARVDAIAEYPLLDPPQDRSSTLYSAYQQIHKKPMINSMVSNSNNELFRDSIANINNWQTVPILRTMGVDAVVFHSEKNKKTNLIPGLMYLSSSRDDIAKDNALYYRVQNGIKLDCILVISKGFDGPSTTDYDSSEYFTHGKSELKIEDIPGDGAECKDKNSREISLEIYTFEKKQRPINITQGSTVLFLGFTNGYQNKQVIKFKTISSSDPITITPVNPPGDFSLVLSNMIAQ